MRTTIDRAGRVVIPKALRDRLNLGDGQEIEVRERDGRVEIEAAPLSVHLEDRGTGVVAVPDGVAPPPLTDEIIRQTIEQQRR